ncbi:MAG: response regulator [Chitinophagales bacterium]|nr:response regulator [Chitinophagales bacterium]
MKTYQNVLFVIVFSFFVLAFFLWQTKRNISNNAVGNQAFQELNSQLQNLNDLNEALASADASSVSYSLSGDPYYLDKFRDDTGTVTTIATRMIESYEAYPEQVANMQQLKELMDQKVQLSAHQIQARHDTLSGSYLQFFTEKKRINNKINQQVSKVRRFNEGVFDGNMARFDKASKNYYITTLIISLATFLVVYFMLIRISDQIKRRKKAEFNAHVNEKKYRELIDQSGVVLFTTDLKGTFTFVSSYATRVTGFEVSELVGNSFLKLVDPDWQETVINFYQHMLNNHLTESTIKFPIITREGEQKWMEQQAVLLYASDLPYGFQCITKDVTEMYLLDEERAKRNQERRESHLLLQSILDNCPQIIFIKDNEGRYIQVNRQFAQVLDLQTPNIIGKLDQEIFGEEIAQKFLKFERRILESQKSVEVRQDIMEKGFARKYSFVLFPLFDPAGKVLGISGIGTDITENVNNQKRLIEALKKAEHAEKLKENFLANMSHEIRTPLNAIIGFGSQLMKTDLPEKHKGFVQNINSASQHLLVLINDILDISKIEQGKMTIEEIDFDFHAVISETAAVMSQRAEEKGLPLKVKIDPEIQSYLKGDPHRLKQILLNMLGNAIKFTEKGWIGIEASLHSDTPAHQEIKLKVTDTGVGMEKEFMANLFDKFSQEDKSVTRRYGGTGLGMSITKHLVELMGGYIEVHSLKNEGTTIVLQLPFRRAEQKPETNATPMAYDSSKLRNCRILLVDDVEMNRMVASAVLSDYGVNITEAENGADAIRLLREQPFDLVLMDLQMPVMDGLNATFQIRNELKLTIPVIALTASAMRRDNERCFQVGMNDYVTKPFNEEELVGVIQKNLA